MQLTVYSSGGHVRQKISRKTSNVQLPKSVDITSIIVTDNQGTVIPFTYIPEMNISEFNSPRKDIQVVVHKNNYSRIEGQLLSFNENNAVILSKDEILYINKYDFLSLQDSRKYLTPQLKFTSEIQNFTVSYLFTDISWKCIATAMISSDKSYMIFRLAGNITNNTHNDIQANVSLVSGELNSPVTPVSYLKSSQSEETKISLLEDYTRYNLGEYTLHFQDIAELGMVKIPITQFYSHDTQTISKVNYGYLFTTPQFIPLCKVNVYSDNSYVGSDTITESQINKEVKITLGQTTRMECKTVIINSKESDILHEDITIKIHNHNSTSSLLFIQHYIGHRRIVKITHNYYSRDNDYLHWKFQVPSGVQEFKCSLFTTEA